MKHSKKHFSLAGILVLLFVLAAGIFTGGVLEICSSYIQTESITVQSVAKQKKKKQQTETAKKQDKKNKKSDEKSDEIEVEKDGEYSSKDEVAAYIHEFGCLPSNYITKKEAQDLGWDNKLGNLEKVAPGKSIGGDRFGNYEELLPTAKGRKYTECDIDFDGGYRGAKRIIFSNDGLIFYTEDHYKTFEPLYDENGKVEKK